MTHPRPRNNPNVGLPVTAELIDGLRPWLEKAVELQMDVDDVMDNLRSIVKPMYRSIAADTLQRRVKAQQKNRSRKRAKRAMRKLATEVTLRMADHDRQAEVDRHLGRGPGR
jgi:hypothetical protein